MFRDLDISIRRINRSLQHILFFLRHTFENGSTNYNTGYFVPQRARILGKGKERKGDIRIPWIQIESGATTQSEIFLNSLEIVEIIRLISKNETICFSFFFNPLKRFRWVKLSKLKQRIIRIKNRDMSVKRAPPCETYTQIF